MLFANQSAYFLLLFFGFVSQKKGERRVDISSCSCIKLQPNTPFSARMAQPVLSQICLSNIVPIASDLTATNGTIHLEFTSTL